MDKNITTFFLITNKMTNCISSRIMVLKTLFCLSVLSCSSDLEIKDTNTEKKKQQSEISFRILILGDSLTEGYGVSKQQAFPYLLEQKLNSELAGPKKKKFEVINAGISGSTTSGGVSRIEWLLKSNPDYLIIALGGNDGLRGIPVIETEKNLERIVLAAKEKKIPTLLAGMKIPPNYGIQYTQEFAALFKNLAKDQNVSLLPFLLKGVGGDPSMNLPDRIHPNPAGHQKISQTVYDHLVQHLP